MRSASVNRVVVSAFSTVVTIVVPVVVGMIVCVFVSFAALVSCGRAGSPSSEDGSEAPATAPRAAAGEGEKQIALTEERLQKYIAYREELNPILMKLVRDVGALGESVESVESRSTGLTKAAAAYTGSRKISERYESEIAALRTKHGFSEAEDACLWAAIAEVASVKVVEGSFMEATIEEFRAMQERGGAEKELADEFFKNLEESQRQGLDEARKKYGAQCVDLLAKHAKELNRLVASAYRDPAGGDAEEREEE